MVGWHHRFNGHEFEQVPRDSEADMEDWHLLKYMGLQTVGHYLVTEQQQQIALYVFKHCTYFNLKIRYC